MAKFIFRNRRNATILTSTTNRYDKYKDSGIEWIGEIPDSWNVVKAKHLFLQSLNKGGKELVLLSATQNDGVIPKDRLEGVVQVKEDADLSTFKSVKKGDFVISLRSFQGGFEYSNYAGVITPAYTVFRKKENICENYFRKLFKSDGFIAKINSLTTGIRDGKNIQYDHFADMFLPLPTIGVQNQIARYLDRKCGAIDETIEKQKSVIEKLKEYKQSIITQAVTKGLDKSAPMKNSGIEWIGQIPQHWEIRKLKTIGDYRNGLTYLPEDICEENNGTLVLRSSNIKNGKISFNDNVYVSSNIPEILKVKKDDILICSRNGSKDLIGKNALIPEELNASFGAFTMIFRCKCPQYMYNILNSHIFSYYLGSFFTSTINQLTGKNFGNMDIVYCPNINEQNQINAYLDKKCSEIDKTIEDKEKLIEKLVEYKKSLIYECVTGKRKVVA